MLVCISITLFNSKENNVWYMGSNSLDAYCVKSWSYFCDFVIFFWNVFIKTDLTLFRQLCGPSNNFQSVLDITCSLRPPGGRWPRLTLKVISRFRDVRGLPIIQTAQNHTLIQNNMLHPSKYYQMHLQLTARTPWGPPGAPKGPPKKFKKIKKG